MAAAGVAALAVIGALPSSGAGAVGGITEFSAGISRDSAPLAITNGPDGALWFTQAGDDNYGVARITVRGRVTEFRAGIGDGARPFGITAGPDGNLWFTELAGMRIARITPQGVVTEFGPGIDPMAAEGAAPAPSGITWGPGRMVWFTELGASSVGRIDMAGGITTFNKGIQRGAGPFDISLGPDGNLWFTGAWNGEKDQPGNSIYRITPKGVVTRFAEGIPAA
ncbi:MAG: hypothetical protein FJW78_01305, partial [Actinobacteria bacterium]|nr:hypothetical protein [Actinomycetota bacterium]